MDAGNAPVAATPRRVEVICAAGVNCYLVAAGDGFVPIDTGSPRIYADLMDSMMGRPSLQFFIDDLPAARTSLARLRGLQISTVYPGHGKPFRLEEVR